MKANILKYSLFTAIALTVFTSCVGEDDYALPTYKKMLLSQNFESLPAGGGATELPVTLDGWVNANIGTGSRVWHVRQFDNNKYADFSSYYSDDSETDQTWLITPSLEIENSNYSFSFDYQIRFYNHNNLAVFISQDYDGTIEGIEQAEWQPINVNFPSSNTNDQFLSSGNISLSEYDNSSVSIAFKYVGNNGANQTTTYQIDNITIFEN
ncbi:MAG: choice-of-anchor J domain-containing protein [Flavobacteriaceae bacterium]